MNDKIWYQINSKNLKKFQVIAKNFDISSMSRRIDQNDTRLEQFFLKPPPLICWITLACLATTTSLVQL